MKLLNIEIFKDKHCIEKKETEAIDKSFSKIEMVIEKLDIEIAEEAKEGYVNGTKRLAGIQKADT